MPGVGIGIGVPFLAALGGAAASPFPATSAPLFLAFDAADADTSDWPSAGGAAPPANFSKAGAGSLSTGTDAAINDRAFIETDGAAYMLTDATVDLSSTSRLEYFVAMYATATAGQVDFLFANNSGTGSGRWHIRFNAREATVLHEGDVGVSRRKHDVAGPFEDIWKSWNGRHDFTAATKEANLFVGGTEVDTQEVDNDNASGTTFNDAKLEIFANQGANLATSGTRIAYILMYDTILSAADRSIVETWMTDNFGL